MEYTKSTTRYLLRTICLMICLWSHVSLAQRFGSPQRPTKLELAPIDTHAFTLSYTPPDSPYDNFSIKATPFTSSESYLFELVTEEAEVALRGLTPGEKYMIEVRSLLQGEASSSARIRQIIPPADVMNISNVTTHDSILLRFSPPPGIFVHIEAVLTSSRTDQLEQRRIVTVFDVNSDNQYEMFFNDPEMTPKTDYDINIKTYNDGLESPSVTVTVQTDDVDPVQSAIIDGRDNILRIRPQPVSYEVDEYLVTVAVFSDPHNEVDRRAIPPTRRELSAIFGGLEFGQAYTFNVSTVINGYQSKAARFFASIAPRKISSAETTVKGTNFTLSFAPAKGHVETYTVHMTPRNNQSNVLETKVIEASEIDPITSKYHVLFEEHVQPGNRYSLFITSQSFGKESIPHLKTAIIPRPKIIRTTRPRRTTTAATTTTTTTAAATTHPTPKPTNTFITTEGLLTTTSSGTQPTVEKESKAPKIESTSQTVQVADQSTVATDTTATPVVSETSTLYTDTTGQPAVPVDPETAAGVAIANASVFVERKIQATQLTVATTGNTTAVPVVPDITEETGQTEAPVATETTEGVAITSATVHATQSSPSITTAVTVVSEITTSATDKTDQTAVPVDPEITEGVGITNATAYLETTKSVTPSTASTPEISTATSTQVKIENATTKTSTTKHAAGDTTVELGTTQAAAIQNATSTGVQPGTQPRTTTNSGTDSTGTTSILTQTTRTGPDAITSVAINQTDPKILSTTQGLPATTQQQPTSPANTGANITETDLRTTSASTQSFPDQTDLVRPTNTTRGSTSSEETSKPAPANQEEVAVAGQPNYGGIVAGIVIAVVVAAILIIMASVGCMKLRRIYIVNRRRRGR